MFQIKPMQTNIYINSSELFVPFSNSVIFLKLNSRLMKIFENFQIKYSPSHLIILISVLRLIILFNIYY